MTLSALNSAISGLKISQAMLDNTARNTANVSTEGYTRKILPVKTLVAGSTVIGARTCELVRNVDEALLKDQWDQTSITNFLGTKESYLNRLQEIHGTPDSETSIAASLSELSQAFSELSATPESQVLHSLVVNSAATLSTQFQNLSQNITDLRNDTQSHISQTVDSINTVLNSIAKLNRAIAQQNYSGRSDVDLLDERDTMVKELSQYLSISYYTRNDGVMVVQTAKGELLADTDPRELRFNATTLNYDSHNGATFNGGIYLGTTDIISSTLGGELGALVSLRDDELPTQQAQLDELAFRMAQRLENQGLQLFVDNRTDDMPVDAAGSYVGFSAHITVESMILSEPRLVRDGFAPAGAPPHAAPAAPAAGDEADNSLITNILNYAFGAEQSAGVPHPGFNTTGLGPSGPPAANLSTGLPANVTLEEYAKQLVVFQSKAHSEVSNELEFESSYLNTLEQRFMNQSGVDLDEEVANLIILQKSYSSAAQMIQAVDEMFKELLGVI